ncbi:protein WALLS ARE THIN 1-like [Aristolochia californica]|uniref:protein WALLS ARE THIN 1-like n=1 Tax=Aristolochia californica TaxID=171875 RepID=UPI0035D86092
MDSVCLWRVARKTAPYAYMIMAQIIAASYAVLSRVIFAQGTSTVVFIVYQFSVATIFMAPLAYFIERKSRPPLTFSILCWAFLLALLGATLFQNLFSASLDYISSTAQSAILNLFPAFTYLLSVASRQEMPELHRFRGIGKLSGTIISVAGAFTMIFWHGDVVALANAISGNWSIGYVLATLGILSLSIWLVLQEPVARRYPAELSITAMMYFFGTIQTSVLAAFVSRNASEWKLNWDLELVNIIFGGVLNSGIGIFIFTWCARVKGPLFVAVFAPLTLLFTAIMEAVFLGERMTIGSIAGSLLIVGGLYLFLWAKSKEDDDYPEFADTITSPFLSLSP